MVSPRLLSEEIERFWRLQPYEAFTDLDSVTGQAVVDVLLRRAYLYHHRTTNREIKILARRFPSSFYLPSLSLLRDLSDTWTVKVLAGKFSSPVPEITKEALETSGVEFRSHPELLDYNITFLVIGGRACRYTERHKSLHQSRSYLHNTTLGRFLSDMFDNMMSNLARSSNPFMLPALSPEYNRH